MLSLKDLELHALSTASAAAVCDSEQISIFQLAARLADRRPQVLCLKLKSDPQDILRLSSLLKTLGSVVEAAAFAEPGNARSVAEVFFEPLVTAARADQALACKDCGLLWEERAAASSMTVPCACGAVVFVPMAKKRARQIILEEVV